MDAGSDTGCAVSLFWGAFALRLVLEWRTRYMAASARLIKT